MGLAINPDGCFQMVKPSVMYPVICVDGSGEEGIGGAGARVALVGPNSLIVRWCGLTSRLQMSGDVTKNQTTYFFEAASDSIRFDGSVNENGTEVGTVTIGSSTFNYVRLTEEQTLEVLRAVYDSGKCDEARRHN